MNTDVVVINTHQELMKKEPTVHVKMVTVVLKLLMDVVKMDIPLRLIKKDLTVDVT